MKFIQETQSFEALKPYFIPAIYHRIAEGRKKLFQLSISIDGIEKVVKKSSKPFEHTSFNKVITGAVKRMEKLFAPDHLNLEVIIYKKPNVNQLELSFELVNKSLFKIGNEDYFASIMCEYSYSKMNMVTYYPIIYRQTCKNGQVAVMSKKFTEVIPADKIFEIGCEWTRCHFESYQNKLSQYFQLLKNEDNKGTESQFMDEALKKIQQVLKINVRPSEMEMESDEVNTSQNAQNILDDNFNSLGLNQFAIWNAITDYASRERDVSRRNQMFLAAGKYISNEVEKTLNKNTKLWSENLVWNEIIQIAKI